MGELKKLFSIIISGSFLGTFIGIIPETRGAIASFLAYNEAKRWARDSDSFGKGNIAGIAAPEAANNGTTGGAMVPLLILGIPGDVVTAACNRQKTANAEREIRETFNVQMLGLKIDVADEGHVKRLVDQTLEKFKRIDTLVNDAGINIRKIPQDYQI